MNKYLTLSGIIIGMVIGSLMLDTVTNWLVISLIALLPLLAYWKAKKIDTYLPDNSSDPNASNAPDASNNNPQPKKSWIKPALMRTLVFSLFVCIGLFSEALWWTQQQTLQQGTFVKKDKSRHLPLGMSLQKVVWQLGIIPLPDLVNIPAGTFIMGDDNGGSDEKPSHSVKLKAFSMSRTEITFAQYDYYIWRLKQADKNNPDAHYPDDKNYGRANRPVINISWHQAQGYVHWLSKQKNQECRLPTEAEWEYAARAGTNTQYYWGDTPSHDYANYKGKEGKDQWKNTAPVASFPPNKFGLYDMSGNVWEWVEDKLHGNYQGAPADGSAWLAGSDSSQVLRGGSWDSLSYVGRFAFRDLNDSVIRGDDFGFRIVCAPIH